MNEEIQDANSTTDPSDSCAIRHDRKKHARTWMPVAAKVLLVIVFVYGTASCLVLGLNLNTDTSESTRSDAPVSDVPITQARAETLGLLLSVYDALDTRADIGPWIPPAPGARDAVRQADQEESFDEHSSCPEGTVSERYRLATTPVTKQKLTSSHAYTLIDDLAEPYGFPRSGNGYTRSTDGASVSAGLSFNEDSFVVSITTGCHPGTAFQDWPAGTEAVPDYLRTTGHADAQDTTDYPDMDTWPAQTPPPPPPPPPPPAQPPATPIPPSPTAPEQPAPTATSTP